MEEFKYFTSQLEALACTLGGASCGGKTAQPYKATCVLARSACPCWVTLRSAVLPTSLRPALIVPVHMGRDLLGDPSSLFSRFDINNDARLDLSEAEVLLKQLLGELSLDAGWVTQAHRPLEAL